MAKSEPGAVSDRVDAAADELYGADPAEFTDRRKELAGAARAAGDADAGRRIAALRKPTRAAWVVNQLARADPDAPGRLAGLAAALRAAEQARDGRRLRELSAERGPLVDALTGQALAAAGLPDPPSGLREEVSATLTAAFADPGVAAGFAAGTLTRAVRWAGFGLASSGDTPFGTMPGEVASGTEDTEDTGESEDTDESEDTKGPRAAPAPKPGSRRAAGEQEQARRGLAEQRRAAGEQEQARRARAKEQRLAEEAAQRAEERRQAVADAERTVASTAAAAAEASAAEDQLEAEVRDLEQRLTQARADLAAARLRARHAEAAARRARQTLDRLREPG